MTAKMDPRETFKYLDKHLRHLACDPYDGVMYAFENRPTLHDDIFTAGGGRCLRIPFAIDIEPGECIEREAERVRFDTLSPGDKFNFGGCTWLVVVECDEYNALCLGDYELGCFEGCDGVTLIEVET